ncbi:MAG: hypothetical protein ACPL6C_04340, partial [bacterium]
MNRFLFFVNMMFFVSSLFGVANDYKARLVDVSAHKGSMLVPVLCVQSNYNGGAPNQNVRACVATTNPDPNNTGGGTNWIGDFVEGDLTGRDLLYDYLHDV